jgi:hypothetical protein
MNDRDMILMTICISCSLLNFSFLFGLSQLHYLYIFFELTFFLFSFSSGICSCMLSIHTVDHWVVFDTIYIHSGTPFWLL